MDKLVFKRMFLTKGVGTNKEKLSSFEMALRKADIAKYNLVKVSSIIPPGCKVVPKSVGLKELEAGQIVFCVLAQAETCEPNRAISSSIGLAIPREKEKFGYISEHHGFGQTARESGDYAEDLAATMLASTLGVPFNLDAAWDQRRELFKVGGHIVKTQNVTQTARGDRKKYWTTVVCAAVFLPLKLQGARLMARFLYEKASEIPADPPVSILPVPMETTVSFGLGTSRGPAAILAASQQVEYYDPRLATETCLAAGIATKQALKGKDTRGWVAAVEKACTRVLDSGGLPLLLGGEHTLTLGGVRAALAKDPALVVVQVDAHADLRNAYQGRSLSHATVMRRCLDAGCELLSLGVRSYAAEEARLWADDPRIAALSMETLRKGKAWKRVVAEKLAGRSLYLTLDLDGLDPSVVPAVGTPVPGGLLWEETLDICAAVVGASRDVVGMDVVELSPARGDIRSSFAAAQLTYHLIGMAAEKNGYI